MVSRLFRVVLGAVGFAAFAFVLAGSAQAESLDLRNFTKEGVPGNGNWTVNANGSQVTQTINGNPTFFVSPDELIDRTFTAVVRVNSAQAQGDDDMIGVVLGFKHPRASLGDPTSLQEFIVFDWKKADQAGSSGMGHQGFALYKINGTINSGDLDSCFWVRTNTTCTAKRAMLGTLFGSGRGWAYDTDYTITVVYESNRILVTVRGGTGQFANGLVVFDLAGNFEPGLFGFYNYSQSGVVYKGTTAVPTNAVRIATVAPSALETAGHVHLLVSLNRAPATEARVTYATTSGTATSPSDYVATSGILVFGPTDVTKTVSVPIVDDSVAESNESFTFTISNPVNATLGAPASTTVTIVDEDAVPIANFTQLVTGRTATFTDTSTWTMWPISSWAWDFGDGATSTQRHPVHTFAADGDHTVTLAVTNAVDRQATRVRTVQVDTVDPVSLAQLTGPAGTNGWWTGTVTVAVTATDDRSGVQSIACTRDGASVACASFSVAGDGVHSVTHVATDKAGNVEDSTLLQVHIDGTPPASTLDLVGTPGDLGGYVSDVAATVAATDATSGVAAIACTLDGAPVDCAGFTITGDGPHEVTYAATDAAGNVESLHTAEVVIDSVPPVSTLAPDGFVGDAGWYRSCVVVTLDAVDASGIQAIFWREGLADFAAYEGPIDVCAEGVHAFEYYAVDLSGNVEDVRSTSVSIDLGPATTTPTVHGTAGANGWWTSSVTVTLAATDTASGVASIRYQRDGGPTGEYDGTPIPVEGTGVHEVVFWSFDVAGHEENHTALPVRIDRVPPVVTPTLTGTLGANGWYTSAVDVQVVASDVGSGIASLVCLLDGTPVDCAGFTIGDDGVHTLSMTATDVAGLTTTPAAVTISIDATAPSTATSLAGTAGLAGWWASPVTVTLSASDATSGVSATHWRLGAGPVVPYAGPFSISTTGVHALEAWSTDAAGLVEPIVAQTIRVDLAPPVSGPPQVVSGTAGDAGWWRSDVTARVLATDAGSGVASIDCALDGGAVPCAGFPVAGDGLHAVDHAATDVAGLVEAVKRATVKIDATPPTAGASLSCTLVGDWCTTAGVVSVTSADATSGVALVQCRDGGGSPATVAGGTKSYAGEGAHSVECRARDVAGHDGPWTPALAFKVDLLAPTISVSVSGLPGDAGWTRAESVTATITAADGFGSGILPGSLMYSLDGGPWTAVAGPVGIDGAGIHSLALTVSDQVGRATTITREVKLDGTAPALARTLTGEQDDDGVFLTNVVLGIEAPDATSGLKTREYSLDNGTRRVYTAPLNLALPNGPTWLCTFAKDFAGNQASTCDRIVLDLDVWPPITTATKPAPNAAGWYKASVAVTLTATDNRSRIAATHVDVDGVPQAPLAGGPSPRTHVVQVPPSAALCSRTLVYGSVDQAANVEVIKSLVLPIDDVAPVLTPVPDPVVEATGPNGAIVTWALPTAADACSGPRPVTCSPASGGLFPVTTTLVTCVASDAAGNAGSTAFTVHVVDTTPPTLSAVEDVALEATRPDGAPLTYAPPSATDVVDANVAVTCLPASGSVFPLGTTLVTCTARDDAGNVAAATFSVRVTDTRLPVIVAPVFLADQTFALPDGTPAFAGDVTIELDAFDVFDSGAVPASLRYRLCFVVCVDEPFLDHVGDVLVDLEGDLLLEVEASDASGNVRALEQRFVVDRTAPTTLVELEGDGAPLPGFRSGVAARLFATDALSGVVRTTYRLDDGPPVVYTGDDIVVLGTGVHTLVAWSEDAVGNVEGEVRLTFQIDVSPPEIAPPAFDLAPVPLPDGTPVFAGSVEVTLSAHDLGPHGLSNVTTLEYEVCFGAADCEPWVLYGQPFSLGLEGRTVVHVRASDEVGNVHLVDFVVVIDLTTPVARIQLEVGGNVTTDLDGLEFWIHGKICFTMPLEDPLRELGVDDRIGLVAGINRAWYIIEDDVTHAIRQVNFTANEVVELLDLPVSLILKVGCVDLPDGQYHLYWGVCDAVGHCGGGPGGGYAFGVDTVGPDVRIAWPPPGSLSLDDITLPLFPTTRECVEAYGHVAPEIAEAVALACGPADTPHAPLAGLVPDAYTALRTTTLLAGQVPVLVEAFDAGSGVASVALFADDVPLGVVNATDALGYYRFVVDTTALVEAGQLLADVTFTAVGLDRLSDPFTRVGDDARVMTAIAVDPPTHLLPARPGLAPPPAGGLALELP